MSKDKERKPMIIAVSNQKGGVAKTTTTGAFGAGLKQKGYKVLTVDLDPQGNLSASVNAVMYECPTVYNLMKREVTAKDAIQKLDMFDIIPANIFLAGIEYELVQTGKEMRLKEMLQPIMSDYDYIILDTPPSLGILTINAFTCASEVIVPTTAGIFAASGIHQLAMAMKSVQTYFNPGLKIAGILITKYNARTIISRDIKELTERIGKEIDAPTYKTFIRASIVVEEAQAHKTELLAYNTKSAVSEDYKMFVNEYLDSIG